MQRWTDAQFEMLSWHDNHVHGFRIVEGEHGSGQLILDIDHILEWLADPGGEYKFRIARAELCFLEVSSLKMAIDYIAPSAAFGPFALDGIGRRVEARSHRQAIIWTLSINWPVGEIEFEARGFEQRLLMEPILTDRQWLTKSERVSV